MGREGKTWNHDLGPSASWMAATCHPRPAGTAEVTTASCLRTVASPARCSRVHRAWVKRLISDKQAGHRPSGQAIRFDLSLYGACQRARLIQRCRRRSPNALARPRGPSGRGLGHPYVSIPAAFAAPDVFLDWLAFGRLLNNALMNGIRPAGRTVPPTQRCSHGPILAPRKGLHNASSVSLREIT
jgi:hypothetical protein